MNFVIDTAENLNVSDDEIFDLLSQVYVQAGFTSAELAKTVFHPVKVKDRGVLFVSKELSENEFSGMVIVVPPKSKAIVRAEENECEMHLLGVSPKYRGHGLGRRLVRKAIDFATDSNWSKMILWTQRPMKEAQNLYESSGFVRTGEMTKNGVEFFVYERNFT